jgi:asparagine synthetase B (glutamine-hydrolysing)
MCSIAGFISKKPLSGWQAERLTDALLYHGSVRGEQSAGIWVNGQVLKHAITPDTLVTLPEYEALFKTPVSKALIHTRQPTSGGVGDAQAQPFLVGDTVSIHNGWFVNTLELKKKWNIRKKSGVDSELVTSFVDSYGIRALPQFLKSVVGSSAFAIIYKDDLYLMRDGNPTAFTIIDTTDGNTIFVFASTPSILQQSIRYCWLLPTYHPIKETKEGILFHVSPDNLKKLSQRVYSRTNQYFLTEHEWPKKHSTHDRFYDHKEFYNRDTLTEGIEYDPAFDSEYFPPDEDDDDTDKAIDNDDLKFFIPKNERKKNA